MKKIDFGICHKQGKTAKMVRHRSCEEPNPNQPQQAFTIQTSIAEMQT